MGGKKKPTLSQMAKKQQEKGKEATAQKKPEKGKGKKEEAVKPVGDLTAELMNQIEKEITKMEYATPYLLSSKYGIKMNQAIQVLRTLHSKGIITLVSKGHRIEIYTTPSRAKELGVMPLQ